MKEEPRKDRGRGPWTQPRSPWGPRKGPREPSPGAQGKSPRAQEPRRGSWGMQKEARRGVQPRSPCGSQGARMGPREAQKGPRKGFVWKPKNPRGAGAPEGAQTGLSNGQGSLNKLPDNTDTI